MVAVVLVVLDNQVLQKVAVVEMVVLAYNLLSLVVLFGTLAVEAAEKEMVPVLLVLAVKKVEMEELTLAVQVQEHQVVLVEQIVVVAAAVLAVMLIQVLPVVLEDLVLLSCDIDPKLHKLCYNY
tara:strand:+ start:277 stop:648 length:372 start_codon:yes stop_codon:yes gene_type:complete